MKHNKCKKAHGLVILQNISLFMFMVNMLALLEILLLFSAVSVTKDKSAK